MGRQIGVNSVDTNKYFSVTGSGSSKSFSIHYEDDGSISSMVISTITTRNRHVSSNNFTNSYSEIGYNSTIEIDNHSDTCCFGKNFRIVPSAEQLFSVTSFLV